MEEQFGPYRLLCEIARGGQGVVYEARHLTGGNRVALKVLLDPDPPTVARFRQEGEVLARLSHPGVVRVTDRGEVGGDHFIAMDYLEGESLKDTLKRGGVPPFAWTAGVLGNVASTLADLHDSGIVHRDLKPANIVVEKRTGLPTLVDFGLVARDSSFGGLAIDSAGRLSVTGEIKGTPSFMAPEQADPSFGAEGPLTDVYGLGSTLYTLLTGRPPFDGPTPLNVLNQVVSSPAPDPRAVNPAVPASLAKLCLDAMSKSPADRPWSAILIARSLVEYTQTEGLQPLPRRKPWLVVGAVCLGALGIVGLGLALGLAGPPPAPPVQPTPPTVTPPPPQEDLNAMRRAQAQALLGEANELVRLGDLRGAERSVDDALALEPEWVEPRLVRCRVLHLQGRPQEAESAGTRAVEIAPKDPRAYGNRAATRMDMKEFERAVSDLDIAIRLDPSRPLYWVQRGEVYWQLERLEESLADCERAIALGARGHVHNVRGQVLWKQRRDVDAREAFDRAIAEDPSHSDAWINRGRVSSEEGKFEVAIAFVSHGIELAPNRWPGWSQRARIRLLYGYRLARILQAKEAGRVFTASVADADRAIKLGDRSSQIYRGRADAAFNLGDLKSAYEGATHAIGIRPDEPKAYLLRGNILATRGEFVRAIQDYDVAIERATDPAWIEQVKLNRERARWDLREQQGGR